MMKTRNGKPTAHPPEGIFLEIVQHDRARAAELDPLLRQKVVPIELGHSIRTLNKTRARLSLYAKRALMPDTKD